MWWPLDFRNKIERKWKWKAKLNSIEGTASEQFWKNRNWKLKTKNWVGEQSSCIDGQFEK
jgi:hypothetical protein